MRVASGRLTREEEQHHPVNKQDWPEDRDVEDLKPAAEESDSDGTSGPVPKLEFGQASNEGPELLILSCGESPDRPVLHLVVERIAGGVELG